MNRFHDFYEDPFSFFDSLNLKFKHFDLNIFRNYERLRTSIFILSLIGFVGWLVMGFDSTPLQILNPFVEIMQGKFGVADFWSRYNAYYGRELHWSAFVIYGLAYVFLSKHFDKFGIHKSKNVCLSTAITVFSISIFEFFWMSGFAVFQNQMWVVTWAMPQLRIIVQNTIFVVAGIIGVVYIWADSYVLNGKEIAGRNYHFNLNWKAILLIGLSIVSALFWIYYPFHVNIIHVPLSDGTVWTNNVLFPQTLYTIKTDVTSSINAGMWFYVENNLIHAVNTLVKAIWTLTVVYIFKLQKPDKTLPILGGG